MALGLAVFAGLVTAVRVWPAQGSDVSAAQLLRQVRASQDTPYSGYVQTLGTLQVPVTDRFTDIGDLFGQPTSLRVWWRAADDWRVDKLLATGETDLVHHGVHTTEWSYERERATGYDDPAIRLPRTADLTPPVLARRLLEDVRVSEATRLPARRIAGRDAIGLRVSPASTQSSVGHVDLWADRTTGVPLRLEVYAKGSTSSSFTTSFDSFSAARPAPAATAFTPPPGARVSTDDVLDIADAANRYADVVPPRTLVGLPESSRSDGAVGVYGRGITEMIVVPLWDRAAVPLRDQLARTPGVVVDASGSSLAVGPLGILLTDYHRSGWLIAGSVDHATLVRAAAELARETRSRTPGSSS